MENLDFALRRAKLPPGGFQIMGVENPGHRRKRKNREAKVWGIARLAKSMSFSQS